MSIPLSQRRRTLVKNLDSSKLNLEIKFSKRINKSPSLDQLWVIFISPHRYGAAVTAVGGGILRVAVYRVAVYWGWRYIGGGGILRMAVHWGWRYIEGDGIMRVAVYWEWRYIESGSILSVAVYGEWRYIESGGIYNVAVYWGWPILRVAVYSGLQYIEDDGILRVAVSKSCMKGNFALEMSMYAMR
jgi:hypothetical protein